MIANRRLSCVRQRKLQNGRDGLLGAEFMTLFAKTVAERTKPGQRQDVEEQEHTFHAYARSEGICGIIISDHDYPVLAAHSLLSKVLDEFINKHPRSTWPTPASIKTATALSFPELDQYLEDYQNPHKADAITKIQKELDETKIVLHKTIESVLERGERLDDLVKRSDGLSAQSKMFYSKSYSPDSIRLALQLTQVLTSIAQAKKQNSCCVVM